MYRKNAAFDEACQNLGITNLCVDGCSICCSDYFFVSENEFLMIAENLMSEGESIESYIEKAKNTEKIIQEQYPELIEKMNNALFIMSDRLFVGLMGLWIAVILLQILKFRYNSKMS